MAQNEQKQYKAEGLYPISLDEAKHILAALRMAGDSYAECVNDPACTPEEHADWVAMSERCEGLVELWNARVDEMQEDQDIIDAENAKES